MRVAIIGGGPAGLYFASLWKKRHGRDEVHLFEQNPADATFGFGVVFSESALGFLRDGDPDVYNLITPHMELWRNLSINHKGEHIQIENVGFAAIGRLELLQLLQQPVAASGAEMHFDTPLADLSRLDGYDLVVAADGVNSLVRRSYEGDFGTSVSYLDNKFVWYGTTKPFDTLTQTFVETPSGTFNAHHYRYSDKMSTFIVECDRDTWLDTGFDRMSEQETLDVCARVFKDTLDGHPLIPNRSLWRNFPWIRNERWSHRNMVLVGDALRTAHYSIGSGTRLALEDVIALVKGLEAHPGDIEAGLKAYEADRRPVVDKLVAAAKSSAAWYEDFPEHMQLTPHEFADSYMTRSANPVTAA
jgi:2-polyprenyl-6-methoxyphenol hydroxylase-like FAD-dependent oxidoreductase